MIHRKKNRPALQRHDILTVSLVSFLLLFFSFIGNLLDSSSAQFSAVLFYLAFYTAPFSSKHFFLVFLFVSSLSTQLLFLVVLLLLLLSLTAFSYVGPPFSLLGTTFSRSFPEPSPTQLFS